MNRLICTVLAVLCCLRSVPARESFANARLAYIPLDSDSAYTASLNGQWKFMLNGPEDEFYCTKFDDGAWKTIPVPSNWETQGLVEPKYSKPDENTGLYRRMFAVPKNWKDRRVLIRFEGVLYGFDFWVNGKFAGSFSSAFNRSDFDITGLVDYGKSNVIAVKVLTRSHGYKFDTNDAWGLSGIQRDVLLFSVPENHVEDLTVVTELTRDLEKGGVKCSFVSTGDGRLKVGLKDPGGRTVGNATQPVGKDGRTKVSFEVDKPLAWSAETPDLYTLDVALMTDGKPVHSFSRRVGIRQVTIDGDVYKINHRPVKLRGVNHHDIDCDAGRALRLEHYERDLKLMIAANINCIRTSHYPPHPMLLDMCDEEGVYVLDEVPFGYGDDKLKDDDYQEDLLVRARATVNRDKNHACVVVWCVGNENPTPPQVVKTVQLVRDLDPTRPRTLSGDKEHAHWVGKPRPGKFAEPLWDGVNIRSQHYPYAKTVEERGFRGTEYTLVNFATHKNVKEPMIMTEYNHALGSAFEGLGERWEVMQQYDRLAGGCIWHWLDQGLRRKISEVPKKDRSGTNNTETVWVDNETYFDSHGKAGSDGIVYADGFPQVDYWVTRKVYSPIVIPEDTIVTGPGVQTVSLRVMNRYEFTDLAKVKGSWDLWIDGKKRQSGALKLSVPPRDEGMINVDIELPGDMHLRENVLRFSFVDFRGMVYERAVRLVGNEGRPVFEERFDEAEKKIVRKDSKTHAILQRDNFVVSRANDSGHILLAGKGSVPVALHAPFICVGRVPSMAEAMDLVGKKPEDGCWEERFLTEGDVLESNIREEEDGGWKITQKMKYISSDKKREGQAVVLDMQMVFSPEGWVNVDYELVPENANGYFLNFGLGLRVSKGLEVMDWVGDGPYNSYPGQTEASERGIYRIEPKPLSDPESRYYDGNRAGVDLAAVTDGKGRGFGFFFDGSTVSLEKHDGHTVFTHILKSAGKGNKRMRTLYLVKADELKIAKGSFRVVLLKSGEWSAPFKDFFRN